MKRIENRLRRDLPALADALVSNRSTLLNSIGTDGDEHPAATRAIRQTSARRWSPALVTAAAAALLVLGVVGLLSIDRDGTDEQLTPVSDVSSQPATETDTGSLPSASTGVPDDSLGDPEAAAVLNVDGESVNSCSSFAPMVPVSSAETPFTIRSGLTSSGGTWISVDDAKNRRVASVCQDNEALLDGAVDAQMAWPIGDDVFVASIEPDAAEQNPVPSWFNSVGRYSLLPVRSTAVIGRIAPDVELSAVPDIQSEAAERERQLIDKIEQVRDLRNYVSSIGVVKVESDASPLDSAGGIEGPLMYWREPPEGERESEEALIEGILIQDGDCLFVVNDEVRSVVLWEYGTRWLADQFAIELPNGTTIAVGSRIEGRGGGYHAVEQLSFFTSSDAVSARAEQCAGPSGEVAVVQS